MKNRILYTIQDQDIPVQGYAVFKCIVPAGAVSLRLFACDFYQVIFDNSLNEANYGPLRSGRPLLYFDTLKVPSKATSCVMLVQYRKGRPRFTADFLALDGKTVLSADWMGALDTAWLQADDPCIGWVGPMECYDLDDDGSRMNFAPVVEAEKIPEKEFFPRPLPYFSETVVKPVKVTEENGVTLFDFGQMVYGRVQISGVSTAKSVKLDYIENLERGWAVAMGWRAMYSDKLLSNKPGNFSHKSFTRRAFRYVSVSGAKDVQLTVHTYSYPIEEICNFSCSDEKLNRLWEISGRTMRICMDDLLNDCPHRDQAQWMDAFVSAQTACYRYGKTDLARKALLQHGICSFTGGRLLAPSICGTCFFVDYSLVQILFIKWYYDVTGDEKLLKELWNNVSQQLDYFEAWRDKDGLLKDVDSLGHLYLDNAFELCRLGKSCGLNALYYGALQAASEIAAILKYSQRSADWQADAATLKKSFAKVFANRKISGALIDSDSRVEQNYWMMNISCALGKKWTGDAAQANVVVQTPRKGRYTLVFASYAGLMISLDGKEIFRRERGENWCKGGMMYRPEKLHLDLSAGKHVLGFFVQCSGINWEMFFDLPDCKIGSWAIVREGEWNSGKLQEAEHKAILKRWAPPIMSEISHGYAAFNGLLSDPDALCRTIPQVFYRHFLSVRVPAFSVEATNDKQLKNWILPCNTPWSAYFFLTSLFRMGKTTEALKWMRTAWGIMLDSDAQNCYEEWSVNASLCHAWGATPSLYLQRDILGIHLENPQRNGKILWRPALGDLKEACGSVMLDEQHKANVTLRHSRGRTVACLELPDMFDVECDLSLLQGKIQVEIKRIK